MASHRAQTRFCPVTSRRVTFFLEVKHEIDPNEPNEIDPNSIDVEGVEEC